MADNKEKKGIEVYSPEKKEEFPNALKVIDRYIKQYEEWNNNMGSKQ